jgi:hypothetical protein
LLPHHPSRCIIHWPAGRLQTGHDGHSLASKALDTLSWPESPNQCNSCQANVSSPPKATATANQQLPPKPIEPNHSKSCIKRPKTKRNNLEPRSGSCMRSCMAKAADWWFC